MCASRRLKGYGPCTRSVVCVCVSALSSTVSNFILGDAHSFFSAYGNEGGARVKKYLLIELEDDAVCEEGNRVSFSVLLFFRRLPGGDRPHSPKPPLLHSHLRLPLFLRKHNFHFSLLRRRF